MTVEALPIELPNREYLLLENVSWDFYEQLLEETSDRRLKITYDNGRLEVMSPMPRHEMYGEWIGRLIDLLCLERLIRVAALGSTTFKRRRKKKGLEPDKCYYVQHVDDGLQLDGKFDLAKHRPPDLAVEVDITSRSIEREPIYAGLGVVELWRFDGKRLTVLHLTQQSKYVARSKSLAFPFLPMTEFARFIARMRESDQLRVLHEFRDWVKSLPSKK